MRVVRIATYRSVWVCGIALACLRVAHVLACVCMCACLCVQVCVSCISCLRICVLRIFVFAHFVCLRLFGVCVFVCVCAFLVLRIFGVCTLLCVAHFCARNLLRAVVRVRPWLCLCVFLIISMQMSLCMHASESLCACIFV